MGYADDLRQEVFNPGTCADLIEGVFTDDSLLNWVDYTPTITGEGVAISGSNKVAGRYALLNSFVILDLNYTNINWSGGGAIGEGVNFSLPLTANAGNGYFNYGGRIDFSATSGSLAIWAWLKDVNTAGVAYFDKRAFDSSGANGFTQLSCLYRRA